MNAAYLILGPCDDCAAAPGTHHKKRCRNQSCPRCGPFYFGSQDGNARTWPPEHRQHGKIPDSERVPWTGREDFIQACLDVGWFSRWDETAPPPVAAILAKALGGLVSTQHHPGRHVRCQDSSDAGPDVNRVVACLRRMSADRLTWDSAAGKWKATRIE